jgi:spermidine synthase
MVRRVKGYQGVCCAFVIVLAACRVPEPEARAAPSSGFAPGSAAPASEPAPHRVGARVIAEVEGAFGPVVVIEDAEGIRRLRFGRDGVDQSAVKPGDPDHLAFAYVRHLTAAFALTPRPHRVLFVGLGGGTLPMFLRRHLPEAHIDIVELDPAVLACARGHLGFAPDNRMTVHLADGRAFLEASEQRWDLIILDAYGEDNIPFPLATRTFLTAVRAHLAAGGRVAANLWGEAVNPLYGGMLATWEAVFPEVQVLAPVGSDSRVVLASPVRSGLTREATITAADALRRSWGLRFDLSEAVASAWQERYRWPKLAPVLEDGRDPRRRARSR